MVVWRIQVVRDLDLCCLKFLRAVPRVGRDRGCLDPCILCVHKLGSRPTLNPSGVLALLLPWTIGSVDLDNRTCGLCNVVE